MSKAMKALAVMMTGVLLFSQAAYANSFSDFFSKSVYRDTLKNKIGSAKWWTSSAWSHKAQNFFVKSVYQDRLHGFAYKKVIWPLATKLPMTDYIRAQRAKKNGNYDFLVGYYTRQIDDFGFSMSITPHFGDQEDPALAGLYNTRGYYNYKLGNLDSAAADWNKALEINPKDTYAPEALKAIGR